MTTIYAGELGVGEEVRLKVILRGGANYGVWVSVDEPNVDFDMFIYDENDNLVAKDDQPYSHAFCLVNPVWTGPFLIRIVCGRGWSTYYLSILDEAQLEELLAQPSVDVASDGRGANRWVTLVGIGDYRQAKMQPLSTTVADAKEVHDVLRKDPTIQQPKDRTRVLVDDGARRNDVLEALGKFAEAAGANDLLLFFFSGHGLLQDGHAILIPYDYDQSVPVDSAIRISEVQNVMQTSHAQTKVLMIDACHSGPSFGIEEDMKGEKGEDAMPPQFYKRIFSPAQGIATLSACIANQVSHSYKASGLSAFSYFVCRGLRGEADMANKGFVTVQDLFSYTNNAVTWWAEQRGYLQTPGISLTAAGPIILGYY